MNFLAWFSKNRKPPELIKVDPIAWSSGQVLSKIWLTEEVEKVLQDKRDNTIWILGGWYGLNANIILTRKQVSVKEILSFDINPECKRVAEKVNKAWSLSSKVFKAVTFDCNELNFKNYDLWSSQAPNLIINSSIEAMENKTWWSSIPTGQMVALQATDAESFITDYYTNKYYYSSLEVFKESFPMTKEIFSGEMSLNYQNDTSYTRFMIIGIK